MPQSGRLPPIEHIELKAPEDLRGLAANVRMLAGVTADTEAARNLLALAEDLEAAVSKSNE